MKLEPSELEGFAQSLRLKDNREITVSRHIRGLVDLTEGLEEFSFVNVKNLLINKKLSGIASGTLRNNVSTIRLYARYKGLDEKLCNFPLSLFPRKQNVVRRTLSDSQIEEFLSVPNRPHMTEARYKLFNAYWSLLSFCALRPGECARLLKSDIDLANKQIILRPEIVKTKQFSTIPLFPNIFDTIKEYVENCQTEYLFPSKNGGTYNNRKEPVIDSNDWLDDFNARLKQCGIEKVPGLVPYSLRHSCATRWIANNMSTYIVRRLMRHVKIEQTLVYEHMTSAHLVPTVAKYDPLVRKYADPGNVLEIAEENLDNFGLMQDPRYSEEFKKKIKDAFFDEQARLRIKKGPQD